MRVLIGLAALVASVNGQAVQPAVVTPNNNVGVFPQAPPTGISAFARITVRLQNSGGVDISSANNANGSVLPLLSSSSQNPAGSGFLNSANWVINVENAITALHFTFQTNQYTGQMQYRWFPNYPNPALNPAYAGKNLSAQSYTCDPCSDAAGVGTPISCDTATGPGATPSPTTGFRCSQLTREYLFSHLVASPPAPQAPFVNSISFQLFDIITNPAPNVSSYSFQIVRKTGIITGDPQIVGMQGQDFQVHGMPDEIFNMVTYPTVQINARFTYLESGACHDNFTACFAHPGTYISEEGFRIGKDKVRVTAGSFKKGLTVHVNGKKVSQNVDLKSGAVQIVSHRRVIVHTEIMKVSVSNSDHFLNQELELQDDKLIFLGQTRKVLKDNERFHPEVPLHGLQGQTWRNVEYASGLEYEGSIMDYHVVDGNLFGTDFVFNQFKA
jgi:hypothetical protein